jgi:hypothetical protein
VLAGSATERERVVDYAEITTEKVFEKDVPLSSSHVYSKSKVCAIYVSNHNAYGVLAPIPKQVVPPYEHA